QIVFGRPKSEPEHVEAIIAADNHGSPRKEGASAATGADRRRAATTTALAGCGGEGTVAISRRAIEAHRPRPLRTSRFAHIDQSNNDAEFGGFRDGPPAPFGRIGRIRQ